jgi:hypothetical protein
VDGQGWLMARWRPGDSPGWTEAGALPAMIAEIRSHAIAASASGHAHRH